MYNCGGYCGGGAYSGASHSYAASPLEHTASYASSSASAAYTSNTAYSAPSTTTNYSHGYLTPVSETVMAFAADDFLDPFRPKTPFVGDAQTIAPFVEEAFRQLMGFELPQDIIVRIGSPTQLAHAYPGEWDPSIAGFALNRVGWGTSEIFARQDNMDRLLLTIGHELGHVMSESLPNIHNEEAKAFAFSLAWMKTIKDNNIAGIGHAINPAPAQNGLHDKAFAFVADLVEHGKAAMDVFSELIQRVISVR